MDCRVAIHTNSTREGHGVLRHTAAHIAAHAVKRLFPSAVQGFGRATDSGFLLDFEVARPFTAEDLSRIECEMARIIEAERRRQAETWCDRFEENNRKWLKSTVATLSADGEPEIIYEPVDTSLTRPRPRLYGVVGGDVIEDVWRTRQARKASQSQP